MRSFRYLKVMYTDIYLSLNVNTFKITYLHYFSLFLILFIRILCPNILIIIVIVVVIDVIFVIVVIVFIVGIIAIAAIFVFVVIIVIFIYMYI
jgi:hypothetical protein